MGQNQPKSFFMLIVIGFLLYHPINIAIPSYKNGHMYKKKTCRQNLQTNFFLSSSHDLVKYINKRFLTQGEKSVSPVGGHNGSIRYFWVKLHFIYRH